MTTQEFKKVGRLLKELYAELEREAISDGIDIFSDEFKQVRDALRLQVLDKLGYTLEEYREAKELVAPAKKKDVEEKLTELSGKTGEIESTMQNLHIPDEDELVQKMHQLVRDEVKAPVIQNNIVERTTVEKPTVVHTTVKETVNEEYDDSPIYAELGYLNDRLDNLPPTPDVDSKIEALRSEIKNDFGREFENNINTLGMPDFRKLAMGLQAQIDEVRSNPTSGGGAWGDITGTLSDQTDLQSALNAKADALGADDNYVTDAEKTVIGNTSGTNTGDNAVNSNYSGLVSNATHTGDATGSAALTVVAINGTTLSGLATGILKNTTGTGVPSIALNSDLPVMTATVGGAVPTPPNNTTDFLRGDGTFATPAGGSGLSQSQVLARLSIGF